MNQPLSNEDFDESGSVGSGEGKPMPSGPSSETDRGAKSREVGNQARAKSETSKAALRALEDFSRRDFPNIQRTVHSNALFQLQQSVRMAAITRIEIPPLKIPRIEITRILTEEMLEVNRAILQFEGQYRRQLADLAEVVRGLQKQYIEQFQRVFERMENMTPDLAKGLRIMAKHGWFLDDGMPIHYIMEVAYADDEDVKRIDELFIEHFRSRMWSIEAQVSGAYRNRRPLLQAAFGAHRNGLYELSVPLLLAQADGVFTEGLGGSPFTRKRRESARTTLATAAQSTWTREVLLSALWAQAAVWLSESERGNSFSNLNRHQVLHGEVVDYGTEVNSLKAASLLNYFAMLVETFGVNDQDTEVRGD